MRDLRSNPKWPVGSFQEQIMLDLKVNVSIHKVYRAKAYALQLIYGTLKEQYTRIYDYGVELMRCNPGSTVKIQIEDDLFKRMYICFGACKTDFIKYCRPLIGMDGCHLKGPTCGILLVAIGVDGNNALYPLAYAVVKGENNDSWSWFIELVKEDIGFQNSHSWCFITDKQKGLMPALDELCPNLEHRCCVRHLYNNFKLKHKGLELKEKMYECARETIVAEFEEQMKEMKKLDRDVFNWFADKPQRQWSKSHFDTFAKSDMLLNNLCESFNVMILDARDKPILTMLERIRCKLMIRLHVNKTKMMKHEA